MSEWQQLMAYCGSCKAWRDALPHSECAQQTTESAVFLDPDEALLTCSACRQIWLIEDTEAVCPACNYVQKIEFRDDMVYLQAGDQLLATNGPIVYILARSGLLIITRRGYLALADR